MIRTSPRRRFTRMQLWGGAIAFGIVGIFAAANAHLVIVAFASQPECVAHVKASGTGGGYSAAKSSC